MLILLPPSEGKAEAGSGRRLDLDRLSLPELNPRREEVLSALVALSRRRRSARRHVRCWSAPVCGARCG